MNKIAKNTTKKMFSFLCIFGEPACCRYWNNAGMQHCVLYLEFLSFNRFGSSDRNRSENKMQLWRKLILDSAVGC